MANEQMAKEKKGYFITYGLSSTEANSGVALKIRNQIEAFNQAGLHCEEITFPYRTGKWANIAQRLPFTNVDAVWEYRKEFDTADFLYMRHPLMVTGAVRRVLKEVKKRNPKVKIVMELPTYPYDKEYETRKFPVALLMRDRYNRERMQGVVDRIANIEPADSIFGLPVLKISNGINVDTVPKREPVSEDLSTIHLCAVAVFSFWHGYERLIEGLSRYYENGGTRNIVCHFVGNGPELPGYQGLIAEKKLEKHVVFHGYLEGKALDEIYNLCTLTVGSLGCYKKDIFFSSELKSRDAVARGIPSVIGCKTDIFSPDQFAYYLEFPNNDSALDFFEIVRFHDTVYRDGQKKVIDAIRVYAKKTVNTDIAMKEVIDYFRS